MGALTLKSFPFELRGWDIEKFKSIDPTDGFGSNTRVYISKNQIIQIEPDYDLQTLNTWLTDKGRQFFDGIFNKLNSKSANPTKKHSLNYVINELTQILYIFDICNKQIIKKYFFVIVFENLSLEVLTILILILQNYSFVKLKRAENFKSNNDLESNFQLNLSANKINSSTLCTLISNNPRYEGYYLNLKLRQRFLKGNFKCLSVGSLVNLSFPLEFLGSNLNIIKTISEGNNLICQDLKFAKNPILIVNNEFLKRNDSENIIKTFKILKYLNIFNKTLNGFNLLNASLHETGLQTLNKFLPVNIKDLTNFSSLYFLNVNPCNEINLTKIVESKILYFFSKAMLSFNPIVMYQNTNDHHNLKYRKNFYYLPNSMFYENEETFISTDGLIKRTTKLVFLKNTKSNWQIVRKIFKSLKKNLTTLNKTKIVYFNSNKIYNFKNFINFQFYATLSLTNFNYQLNTKTCPFALHSDFSNFKTANVKLNNTKLKYWLDDFFSGGKDQYSQNSLTMSNCSIILRFNATNFF